MEKTYCAAYRWAHSHISDPVILLFKDVECQVERENGKTYYAASDCQLRQNFLILVLLGGERDRAGDGEI